MTYRPWDGRLNRDAQPPAGFNAGRRLDRDITEMLGLAKGVLFDGEVSESEVLALRAWAGAHPDALRDWAARRLYERLEHIFADGVVTPLERRDLAELLRSMVGGTAGVIVGENAATELPLDQPPPRIVFPDQLFVFTGKFAFGPRVACEEAVMQLGGTCAPTITRKTSYVVIGTFGSRDWIQSSHGRKIEKAVGYRDTHGFPRIIGEDHWAGALP